MILAPLFGATLVVAAATDSSIAPADTAALTAAQKQAATEPLVRSATDCIVGAVTANPRFKSGAALGDLIVQSMPACVGSMRAMIDAYDRYYGEGTGEAFFMGPYLDVLPKAVLASGKKAAQ